MRGFTMRTWRRKTLRERLGLNDYCSSFISKFEIAAVLTVLYLTGAIIGFIFYDHLIAAMVLGFIMMIFFREYAQYKRKRLKIRILDEFVVVNNIVLGEISGHASVESVYLKIAKEASENKIMGVTLLKEELMLWGRMIEIGERPEKIIQLFANKLKDNTILQYSSVFKLAMSQGVDLKRVIATTNRILREKSRMNAEINVMISEKKLEQKIMSVMPFVMIFFLKTTSKSFVLPLYNTVIGRVVMTILLLVFACCYIWSNKITDIV